MKALRDIVEDKEINEYVEATPKLVKQTTQNLKKALLHAFGVYGDMKGGFDGIEFDNSMAKKVNALRLSVKHAISNAEGVLNTLKARQ